MQMRELTFSIRMIDTKATPSNELIGFTASIILKMKCSNPMN